MTNFIKYNGRMMPVKEVIKLKKQVEAIKAAPKKAATKKTVNTEDKTSK